MASKSIKYILSSIINLGGIFQRIKDSPSSLSMIMLIIIPLIILGLRSMQFYILLKGKLNIPQIFSTPEIDYFMNGLLIDVIKYYASYIFFGFLVAFTIFMLGAWRGGLGGWKHGIATIGFVYIPNVMGLMMLTILFASFPVFKTGVVTTIGYPLNTVKSEYYDYNIIVNMKNYVGENSNLTIAVYAEYVIPLNATKSENGIIRGETVLNAWVEFKYVFSTVSGVNTTTKTIILNSTSMSYNTPIVLKDVEFNFSENNAKRFVVDLILFLNNTYISPVQENFSVPYVLTLSVYEPDAGIKSYDIKSDYYTLIQRFPDIQPLSKFMEDFNWLIWATTIIVNIWHFFLFSSAMKIIHDFGWRKTMIFTGIYLLARLFLGFGI